MLFTNDHDLREKITFDDRRVFMIRPNPQNGSLLRDVIIPKYGNFYNFSKKLDEETSDIIHIIASCKTELKSPLQLPTKAKVDYFSEKGCVTTFDLKETSRFFIDKSFNKKVLDILLKNSLMTESSKIKLLRANVINYTLFKEFYAKLQQNGLTNKSDNPLFAWERFKEKSLNNGFKSSRVDYKETKKFSRYRDNIVISPSGMGRSKLLLLKKLLRELYGKIK
jgi:hypothetical protein